MGVASAIVEPKPTQGYAANRVSPCRVRCPQRNDTTRRTGNCAGNSARYSGSIGECAVLRLHFVVLENDRDRIFALTINVRRLLRNRRVLSFRRSRLTQNRFHLLLRHAFRDLIHVHLGDSLADAAIEHEHEHEHEHESRRNSEHRSHGSHSAHLSHSPITKSRLPSTAGTSLTKQPGKSSGRILRFTKDGARIFNRYGTPPPLLLM
jgi:hypothetical protein